MPKRSLRPGNGGRKDDSKKIESLNQAVDGLFAGVNSKRPKVEAEIEPLVRIAAELRNLPTASFKARLKSELKGSKRMSTIAEPVAGVRVSAAPRLAFRDPAKAIEFYQRALGAKEIFRFQVGDDIPHAELRIGDSSINIAGEWPEGGRFSAETLGHSPIWMTIQVPDVDAFTRHAAEQGMKVVAEPRNQFYGHRDARLEDPFGYTWAVFTVTEEMPVEEMHRRMQGLSRGPEGGAMPSTSTPKVNPVRPGFRMITPYLVAADGIAELEFVKNAFGAAERGRALMPTGVHGELRIGDSMLMIGGGLPDKPFPADRVQPNALHVYVEDADAVYAKAIAAGATSISAPQDQDYGERSATVKDAAGNFWYIATHKGGSFTPIGLYSVNPYLHPRRAEPLIAFLQRAFAAEVIAKYASPDGVIAHAQVRVGNSVIEMGEAHDVYQTMNAMFYVYVPDIDAAYRKALAAGAISFQEPTDQPYGDRNAGVKDTFGNKWYLASHVRDMPM